MPTSVCADGDQFGTDGNNKLQLLTGCGIITADDGSGITLEGLEAWPHDCDIETAGGRLYCDPLTGVLRAAPPDRHGTFLNDNTNDNDHNIQPGNTTTVNSSVAIDLTEHCEDVDALVTVGAFWNLDVSETNLDWDARAELRLDGNVVETLLAYREDDGRARRIRDRRDVFTVPVTLTAGASYDLQARLIVTNNEPNNGDALGFVSSNVRISGSYHTRRP